MRERPVHLLPLLSAVFFAFTGFSQSTREIFIQSPGSQSIVFEAESGAVSGSPLAGAPYWTSVADPMASGGNALQADDANPGDGVFPSGLDAAKAVFYLQADGMAPVTFYVYLLVKIPAAEGTLSKDVFLQSAINEPAGSSISVSVTASDAYEWKQVGSFVLQPGQTSTFILFPDDKGILIDKVAFHTDSGLDDNTLDGLGLTVAQEVSSSGIIGSDEDYSEGVNPVGLNQETGGSSGYTIITSPSAPGVGNAYFPSSGTSFIQMNCTSSPCNPNLTFYGQDLNCVFTGSAGSNNFLDYPIIFSFDWFAPGAPNNFARVDMLTAEIVFYGPSGNEITNLPAHLQISQVLNSEDLMNGTSYQTVSLSLPTGAGNPYPNAVRQAALRIRLNAGEDIGDQEEIWIDNVRYYIPASAPSSAEANFVYTPLPPNMPGSQTITFGNTSQPLPAPPGYALSFLWDFDHLDAMGNPATSTESLDGEDYMFPGAGTYNVCLTVTVRKSTGPCNGFENQSKYCQEITVIQALPVTLTRFTARADDDDDDVTLDWETAAETGNSHFLVEHSTDGRAFQALTRVAGAGDSRSTLRYRWLHRDAPAGINYYRLRQVDFDGTFAFSNVVSVRIDGAELRLFPNPAHSEVQVSGQLPDRLSYALFDAFGRLLRRAAVAPDGRIALTGLAPGIYSVRLEGENETALGQYRVVKM